MPAAKKTPAKKAGTYGDRKGTELKAALEIEANPDVPVYPFPPGLPEAHKKYWCELVNSKPHDYFNKGDHPLLKLYCRAAADIDRLDKQIQEEGDLIENAKGNMVVNPKIVVRSIAETRLMSLSTKLRAQPTSRFDIDNDKAQQQKKKNATSAAKQINEDGDDGDDSLLAGASGLPPRMVQ